MKSTMIETTQQLIKALSRKGQLLRIDVQANYNSGQVYGHALVDTGVLPHNFVVWNVSLWQDEQVNIWGGHYFPDEYDAQLKFLEKVQAGI